ncbi:transcription-repair coupling factor [Roseofilum reptotaenium CS-1145]|uniref:Transcription-repair-coupling factor n=1 Tax=Roseofilum reptotaenium AO1-A TaxID=1925591 RepID=A0A1L9QNU6_9CYAN|nr:transcription-repair coupling factor [Roseofilum reptotaenium]MDB9519369.1 transcription-repair coupling factor [Roseofilum reptotaenium CS-1145]OJJ24334.1 transcription-repair coupling factor [Roseofilum reptotaenium AO1-A]
MAFSSILRTLRRSPLTQELLTKLKGDNRTLALQGIPRFPKGLVASALSQAESRSLLVVTATMEEANRWTAQLEAMDWDVVLFYPTTEASPYESSPPEPEMVWGQMQVLAELVLGDLERQRAIVCTERALQPHLPPLEAFKPYALRLQKGDIWESKALDLKLSQLGYERVTSVETEGQWSRRGDIVDIFPVASELPVRLEWWATEGDGDAVEKIKELDPATGRSLDPVPEVILTPTAFTPIIEEALTDLGVENLPEFSSAYLGLAFDTPASLLDYLPEQCLIAIDEPSQCESHSDNWVQHVEEQYQTLKEAVTERSRSVEEMGKVPPIHRSFAQSLMQEQTYPCLHLSELAESNSGALNLSSRPVPVLPHQFAKLAQTLREEMKNRTLIFVVSAQPSRSVSLLQEHDCAAKFIPNPKDYQAIESLQVHYTPIALKYSGVAELEGFVLPTFRIMVVSDREFYGQHSLATPSYIRKRRRAASKQVDPNTLKPGDYVVHKSHGVGRFIKLEKLTVNDETREYLVIKYEDGLLRVAADQVGSLSRFRSTDGKRPTLHKLAGKTWEKTKNKVRKTIKKLAVDLLKLYAARSQQEGFAFPSDSAWQEELEDSFPYQPTPDQLKATQDIKRDMESPRPMDRLVCGDVGFGKTEVGIRAIFKAVTAGKQVAFLAPTTILTQQHYHTLKERFAPYPIEVGLLNRFRTPSERKEIQQRLATGELDVVVGTQALLSKEVKYRDLGLLVVDEEQRFGVNQKEKIKALKTQVDVLTLSATPIPRTLYMSLSGVREMSLITTPPPSRRPIKTHLAAYNLEAVRTAIRQELDRGGQVFYVVPRVEGIEEISTRIRETVPGVRLAIAHGQMAETELEATMLSFSNGEADVLVCTTIIESGLDIPRVNTILIEDAQKFGLSQLYQLRGRVGRAGIQAHAWLFYPDRRVLPEPAQKRLRAIQEFTQLGSGYQLAMRDMEIRGVGNLLGAEQSGQMTAIGFDLYMEMLQESIQEIQGQEIPKVDDTSIDLPITAFIPADYIPDIDQKMRAYRSVAAASCGDELRLIEMEWSDRYGTIPQPAQQLIQVMELKQLAKSLGFSRIKPNGKQHVVLETPMEEPAWNLLKEKLDRRFHARFIYSPKKVTVRGLGVFKPNQQLDQLINWFSQMQAVLTMNNE